MIVLSILLGVIFITESIVVQNMNGGFINLANDLRIQGKEVVKVEENIPIVIYAGPLNLPDNGEYCKYSTGNGIVVANGTYITKIRSYLGVPLTDTVHHSVMACDWERSCTMYGINAGTNLMYDVEIIHRVTSGKMDFVYYTSTQNPTAVGLGLMEVVTTKVNFDYSQADTSVDEAWYNCHQFF